MVSWWICTGVLTLAWLTIPLWWRSGGAIYVLGIPLAALTLLFPCVWLILMDQARCLRLRGFLFGCGTVALGLTTGFSLDHQVRRWFFSSSYSDYQAVAREFIASPPEPTGPTTQFTSAQCDLAGVYAGNAQSLGGSLIVTFYTPYGPSLETSFFSSKPMSFHRGENLELVRVDDMGYWYLVL